MIIRGLLLVLALVWISGCGDDDTEPADTICPQAARKLCELACQCGGGTCEVSTPAAIMSFDNLDGCLQLYETQGCAEESTGLSQACLDALGSAECAGITPTDALELPQECLTSG